MTNFCLHNCGLCKKFRHCTLLAGINKSDDVFVSPSTVDAVGAIYLSISSIGLIFTVFVAQMAV